MEIKEPLTEQEKAKHLKKYIEQFKIFHNSSELIKYVVNNATQHYLMKQYV